MEKTRSIKLVGVRRKYKEFRSLVQYASELFGDLGERLIQRREYDRYLPIESQRCWEGKREKIRLMVDRLGFLLDSALPRQIVENLVASEILEETTLGSQSGYLRVKTMKWNIGGMQGMIAKDPDIHPWNKGELEYFYRGVIFFQKFVPILRSQYPSVTEDNLAEDIDVIKYSVGAKNKPYFTFFDQLPFRYACYLSKTHEEANYEAWFKSILKKYKWYFEKIALLRGQFGERRRREQLLRLLSEELTGDPQMGKSSVRFFLLKEPGRKSVLLEENGELKGIIEEVIGCLGAEAIRLLETKDSKGNAGSFEEQLKDRFSYRKSSFVSRGEIKEHIKKKAHLYKPLINKETVDVVRDILLDDFDKELFVSKATHLWNKEMMDNLKNSNAQKASLKVKWAIDKILESIDPSLVDSLSLTLENQTYNLKSLLLARGKRAGLAGTKRNFKKHLSSLHIYTIYCPKYGSKETLSMVDLQSFLGEIDALFLYPRDGRIFKLLGSRNDEGLMIGWRGRFKDVCYFPKPRGMYAFRCAIVLFIVLLMLSVGV